MARTRPPKIADLKNAAASEAPSRSQKKRDLEKIRQFGMELLDLPAGRFAKVDLPEQLRDALVECRRLTDNNARRRQLQFIQAVMEQCDVDAIRESLANIDRLPPTPKAVVVAPPSKQEKLADDLVAGGDPAVFALSDQYDAAALQTLRQAVRKARKDVDAGKDRKKALAGVVSCLARL